MVGAGVGATQQFLGTQQHCGFATLLATGVACLATVVVDASPVVDGLLAVTHDDQSAEATDLSRLLVVVELTCCTTDWFILTVVVRAELVLAVFVRGASVG